MMYDDNAFDLNSDQFFPEGDEPSNQEEAAEEAPAAEEKIDHYSDQRHCHRTS